MKANLNDNPLKAYLAIPSEWPARPLTAKYNELPAEELRKDGWRDLITPQLLEFEELGAIEYDAALDRFFFNIEKWTAERIRTEELNRAENARLEALQTKTLNETAAKVEAITDAAEALKNQTAFRIWDNIPAETLLPIGFKCQDFVGKELKLFNCKQPHEKRADRRPADVKALWDVIEFAASGIEIWSQPDGASGKYLYLDPKTGKPYQVIFNGNVWENTHNAGANVLNVWKPGDFGWKLIGPAPK